MRYRLYAKSVLGPKYARKGIKKCQDSSLSYDSGKSQKLYLADGHGDENCFRSEIGSELAIVAGKMNLINI